MKDLEITKPRTRARVVYGRAVLNVKYARSRVIKKRRGALNSFDRVDGEINRDALHLNISKEYRQEN